MVNIVDRDIRPNARLENMATPNDAVEGQSAELAALITLMKRYVDSPLEIRRLFNAAGVHLSPANYYSAIPTINEIDSSFEYLEEVPYETTVQDIFDHEFMT